jgi:CRP-like cAMP-binding protein
MPDLAQVSRTEDAMYTEQRTTTRRPLAGAALGMTLPPGPAGSPYRFPRFLDLLDVDDRQFLLTRSIVKSLGKHQALYVQGDPSENLFVIMSGAVKVHYIQDNGASLTTSYCREGMLVGAHGCTRWAGNHTWSAQALVDSRVLWIRRDQLLELTERSPRALRCVLAVSEFKGEQLKQVIRILAEPTVERRISLALRHLGSLYGIDRGEEIEIDGRFTHQEIAEMIGASRQSVTTLLVSLERSGEIRREGRRLFISAVAGDPCADQPSAERRSAAERRRGLP